MRSLIARVLYWLADRAFPGPARRVYGKSAFQAAWSLSISNADGWEEASDVLADCAEGSRQSFAIHDAVERWQEDAQAAFVVPDSATWFIPRGDWTDGDEREAFLEYLRDAS